MKVNVLIIFIFFSSVVCEGDFDSEDSQINILISDT